MKISQKNALVITIIFAFLISCATLFPADVAENAEEQAPNPTPRASTTVEEGTEIEDENPLMGSIGLDDSIYPKQGNGGYDAEHYEIVLSWTEGGQIGATTTMTAVATQNLSGFYLDFHALTVDEAQVNGAKVNFERDADNLNIILADTLSAGESFECAVSYHGVPEAIYDAGFDDVGWAQYETGVFVVSEPNGAMTWYPSNNHPLDKASYSFEITVPKPYVAVANGAQTEVRDDEETRTYFFSEDDLMASYLTTVNIAEFIVEEEVGALTGLPISNYVEKSLLENANFSAFDVQDEMIAYLSEIFGPYPFDEIGGIVPDAPFGGGLETQPRPVYGREVLDEGSEYLMVHELAHQWFGNSLALHEWEDMWLNEGFATYTEILWDEHLYGKEEAFAYLHSLYEEMAMESMPPGDIESEFDLFNYSVYYRGALVLHALRAEVGDEAFFEILQVYTARYAHSNVKTEDFIAVAEEVSEQDLVALFNAWLYDEEMPPFPEVK